MFKENETVSQFHSYCLAAGWKSSMHASTTDRWQPWWSPTVHLANTTTKNHTAWTRATSNKPCSVIQYSTMLLNYKQPQHFSFTLAVTEQLRSVQGTEPTTRYKPGTLCYHHLFFFFLIAPVQLMQHNLLVSSKLSSFSGWPSQPCMCSSQKK